MLRFLVAVMVAGCALVGATVSGSVTDESGASIRGATVRLLQEGQTATQYRAQTNDAGEFKISDVAPGKYTVRASFTGFTERVKSAEVVDWAPGDVGTLALGLAGCDAPHVFCDPIYPVGVPIQPPDQILARKGFGLQSGCQVDLDNAVVKCPDKGSANQGDLQLERTSDGAIYLKPVNHARISDCEWRTEIVRLRLDGLGPGNDWCIVTNSKHHAHVFTDLRVIEPGDDHVALWVVTRK